LSGVGDEKDLEVSLDGEVIMGGISESEEQSAMVGWLVLFCYLHLLSPYIFFILSLYHPTNFIHLLDIFWNLY
jgi:hypothetical protein